MAAMLDFMRLKQNKDVIIEMMSSSFYQQVTFLSGIPNGLLKMKDSSLSVNENVCRALVVNTSFLFCLSISQDVPSFVCEANPQVYVETPLHPEKLTVWCALWAAGIIGPYFFKNDEGHNVTVNGDRYRAMITNFFFPELNNHDVQELWFQLDGATCHTARATIDLLKDTFGDRLISRFGPVNWPPRSCDLTP
ncbi:putative transposable element [Trichonephila clavipes]|nr:putative transposable element [Trichonephila clavipes]